MRHDDITETVYAFICQYIEEHGFGPTHREIASACYISRASAAVHIDRLEARGRIVREPGKARSIALPKPLHER